MSQHPMIDGSETEVLNAVTAFEEILRAIPTDRVALETLFEAHRMLGNTGEAEEYLLRLTQVIIDENDAETAAKLLPHVSEAASGNPDFYDLKTQLDLMTAENEAAADAPPAATPTAVTAGSETLKPEDMTVELSLAWTLMKAGELTESEYSNVVHDLSEIRTRELTAPASVLHVLEDRESLKITNILAFLNRDTSMPLIDPSHFEISSELTNRLPFPMIQQHGALPFSSLAGDLLVVILNPYNERLKKAVRQAAGCPCHFYLCRASDYDAALRVIVKSRESALAG